MACQDAARNRAIRAQKGIIPCRATVTLPRFSLKGQADGHFRQAPRPQNAKEQCRRDLLVEGRDTGGRPGPAAMSSLTNRALPPSPATVTEYFQRRRHTLSVFTPEDLLRNGCGTWRSASCRKRPSIRGRSSRGIKRCSWMIRLPISASSDLTGSTPNASIAAPYSKAWDSGDAPPARSPAAASG
jgi:hypothetical protein